MAKKKTNTLGLVYSAVCVVGAVLAIVGLFLNIWTTSTPIGNTATALFAGETEGLDYAWLSVIAQVLMIILAVCVVAYVVLALLTACKVGKFANIAKIVAIVALLVTVLIVICGVLFCVLTSGQDIFKALKTTIAPAVGFYLIVAGGLLTGVCGLLNK